MIQYITSPTFYARYEVRRPLVIPAVALTAAAITALVIGILLLNSVGTNTLTFTAAEHIKFFSGIMLSSLSATVALFARDYWVTPRYFAKQFWYEGQTPLHLVTICSSLKYNAFSIFDDFSARVSITPETFVYLHRAEIPVSLPSVNITDPSQWMSVILPSYTTPSEVTSAYRGQGFNVNYDLLNVGANINVQDCAGFTPLHWVLALIHDNKANERAYKTLHHFLLKEETLLDIKAKCGMTPYGLLYCLKKEQVFNLISQFKPDEIAKLLKKNGIEKPDGNFTSELVTNIAPYCLCLASIHPDFQNIFHEFSSSFNEMQLETIFYVWKNNYGDSLIQKLELLSSHALSRFLRLFSDEDLEFYKNELFHLLNNRVEEKQIQKLIDQVNNFIKRYENDLNPPIEDVLQMQSDLHKWISFFEKWRSREENITSLIGEDLQEKIRKAFKNMNNALFYLENFQRKKSIAMEVPNSDQADIFAILTNLGMVTLSDYQEKLGCDFKTIHQFGIHEGRDLNLLGISDDLDQLIGKGDVKSIIEWKMKNQIQIETIKACLEKSHSDAALQVDRFLKALENFCLLNDKGSLDLLRDCDRDRRIGCLKAYLSQEGIDFKDKSISELSGGDIRGPEFLYALSEYLKMPIE